MADNVRIVGEVLEQDRISRYSVQDEQLLFPIIQQETFGRPEDYVEYFIFDLGGNVLNANYNYKNYKLPSNASYSQSLLPILEIDPVKDIEDLGYQSGDVTSRYNFFRRVAGSPFSTQLFISQISSDRTEIRVDSTELSDIDLIDIAGNFIEKQSAVPYYYYVMLNFSNNVQIIAVNVLSEVNNLGEASLLFKLYEPLPANIALKETFWIVEEIINPYVYDIRLTRFISPPVQPSLRGPNFSIDLEIKNVVPTQYNNLTQLVTSFTGSSYQAILNSLTNQQVNINVDYSLLNDFIHYSSAVNRIDNFVYKIKEIEKYQYEINVFSPLTASNASLIGQVTRASSSLNTTIASFDGFESYLYYTSSSLTSSIIEYMLETGSYLSYNIAPYPKSDNNQPYILYPSSDTVTTNWYNNAIEIATAFDTGNKDILINTIPSYILEDPDNYTPYIVFVNMIGQHFDNVWVYIDKLTDVWDNNNNLNEGISQDLVYDWLKSFGMKLYNSQGNQNLLEYNIGNYTGSVEFSNPDCTEYIFTNISSVFKTQLYVDCFGVNKSVIIPPVFGTRTVCALSGSYLPLTKGVEVSEIGPCYDGDYSPSSSFLNNVPRKDLVLDIYKRLYHNLPYLFKGKGAHGGLQGLITLFGITGSILPIKEYGGTTDYQDLKGYAPEKIYVGSNNLTGSILSSIKRFETPTTSSRAVRSQDLHFIDVSFSPQTQIDSDVSSSITAVNPEWVIDDYIAYPEALYLDTYPSLSYQRDYWFGQTFTHPSEGFDYGGFIRLIQFFDNSLFKMIKDFTPARGNTWTGVSIKSPVLERPKVPEARPLFTSYPDLEGEITGALITPVYDPYYFELAGDKEPYYTGNITGSTLNTYTVFEENNINPFLVNNTVGYIPPGFVSGNTDFILDYTAPYYESFFYNSDFNALQNNVNLSLTSQYRKKLTPILSSDSLGRVFTSYSVTESVELQDSYLSTTAYVNSRYDGVRLYGFNYNVWSFGDTSYGLTPVINHNTKKLGLFTEVIDSFFPNKCNVSLKYLVDETGRLTELNQRNRNWSEVQNTFETGDLLNISLFNPQQYSNQIATNGNKSIHESGYSYSPVLYYFGSSALAPTQYIPFFTPNPDLGIIGSNYFELYPSGGKFIPDINYNSSSEGGLSERFEVWDLFNTTGSSGNLYVDFLTYAYLPPSTYGESFYTGSGPGVIDSNGANVTSSYYIIPVEGAYEFYYNFDINVIGDINTTFTGSMEVWLSSSIDGTFNPISSLTNEIKLEPNVWNGLLGQQSFTNLPPPTPDIYGFFTTLVPQPTTVDIYNGFTIKEYSGNTAICGQPSQGNITLQQDTVFRLYKIQQTQTYGVFSTGIIGEFWMDESLLNGENWRSSDIRKYQNLFLCENNTNIKLNYQNSTLIDTTLPSYQAGDKIVFRFFCKTTRDGSNQIESASLGTYISSTLQQDNPNSTIFNFQFLSTALPGVIKVVPSNGNQVATSSLCVSQENNTFIMGNQLSSFYGPNYYFNPLNPQYSASFSPLYEEYGYVGYPFQLEPFDKILIQIDSEYGFTFEYNISQVARDGNGNINILIQENISGYFPNDICNRFYKIVFLKRIPDETNIIVNLVKPPGKTSYGFIIPQNLAQNVLDNLDNITKNVKLQLIEAGSNVIV